MASKKKYNTKGSKSRSNSSYRRVTYRSSISKRQVYKRFLIVCEGEKTEPSYFKRLKAKNRLSVEVEIKGLGSNTLNLFRETKKIVKAAEKEGNPFDEVWLVFDKDDFPPYNFDNAISGAIDNGYRVAYSNECFELWYLLHFDYVTTGICRSVYASRLTKKVNCLKGFEKFIYKKNCPYMYDILFDSQEIAIANAERLLKSSHSSVPSRNNPCTTVHNLVKELNKHKRS